jgi:alpha-L-rhamnosidase
MSLKDYRPAPFWFLNHKLKRDEITRQLQLMSDCGISGFFIHPRAGLKTPYMSKVWLDMVKFIVDEAEQLGLKAWLYDEDPFPSGAVGGKLFFDHPEFAAREVKFFDLTPDSAGVIEENLGSGTVLSAIALRRDAQGKVIEELDISDSIGMLRSDFFKSEWNSSYYVQIFGKKEYPHYRAETFNPHLQLSVDLPAGNWKVYITTAEVFCGDGKYVMIPDNLNKKCVRYFINQTHEKYREKVGDKFGSVIPGIFTDEPAVGAPVPWTGELEQTFKQTHGYSIRDKYHHLFKNIDETSRTVRKYYWETVYKLFAENYFGQIADWCKNNSLELCGHCIGEEDPLVTTGGSNTFGLQSNMDIPGFDHITNNIPNGAFQSLNLGGKLIASSALQQGKEQVLSECFGCNPFNFGHDGMRKVANWLFALGVNWLVPHGFFYSYDGHRKFDAGKSFFFQDEDFSHFKDFAAYAERIGSKLGQAKSLNHVCILFPVSVFRSLLPAEKEIAEEVREKLFNCVQALIDGHVQFDLADEETLLNAKLVGNLIECGKQRYDTIILPQLDELQTLETKAVVDKYKELISIVKYPEMPLFKKIIKIFPDDQNLMLTVKENDDGILAYIFNNSKTPRVLEAESGESCAGCYLFDAESGVYSIISEKEERYQFAIGGFEAVILEFRKKKLDCAPYIMPKNLQVKEYNFEKNPEWKYIPPGEDYLVAIHSWDIAINGNGINKFLRDYPFCLIRELIGTESQHTKAQLPRAIFDTVPEVPSIYPLKMEFSKEFKLSKTAITQELLLVFENDTFVGDYQLFINDHEIEKNTIRRQRIYDPMNNVTEIKKYCHTGNNIIRIIWEQASEFHGLQSSIYIKAKKWKPAK